jgi:two-component system chemotaxis sensor kinase CheA
MYSKKLTRQIRRFMGGDYTLDDLPEVQDRLSKDPHIPEKIRNLAVNLFAFLQLVDETYSHADDQFKMAVRNLTISSEELNSANINLEKLNVTINAMLESQGEGLLFFGADGLCSPVFSRACLDLLETNPGGQHIADVLKLQGNDNAAFRTLVTMLFSGQDNALDFNDLIGLAPVKFNHSQNLSIHIKYRPMRDYRGRLAGILVVAVDRTAETAALKAIEMREVRANRLLRIAQDRNGFLHFLDEFKTAFTGLDTMAADDFARSLHTLKGRAAFFWLKDLAAELNALEQAIHDNPPGSTVSIPNLAKHALPSLENYIEDARITAREIWGGGFDREGETRSIELERIYSFAKSLREKLHPDPGLAEQAVRSCLYELAALPVSEIVRNFDNQLQDFGLKAGIKLAPVRFEGDDLRILPEAYSGVFESFVHIARNIIDHGIEPPEQRAVFGKPKEGHVVIHAEPVADKPFFMLSISDDGAGIDTAGLRSKFSLPELSDHDISQSIFGMHVTMRGHASDISGRGIGLNAVKAEIEKLGGTIEVVSIKGKGTTFRMMLPIIWDAG